MVLLAHGLLFRDARRVSTLSNPTVQTGMWGSELERKQKGTRAWRKVKK